VWSNRYTGEPKLERAKEKFLFTESLLINNLFFIVWYSALVGMIDFRNQTAHIFFPSYQDGKDMI
jgi:hypothetical protein